MYKTVGVTICRNTSLISGLSAAARQVCPGPNAKNKNRDLVVLGAEICSPPLHRAPLISNYLGLPPLSGEELRQAFLEHASRLGINIVRKKADNVFPDDEGYLIIAEGEVMKARTVIICTGIPYRQTRGCFRLPDLPASPAAAAYIL